MDLTTDLILALHFLGLFMGGAAGLGLPVIGAIMPTAPVEHRPSIGKVARPLRLIGQSGVGLLILTGLILVVTSRPIGSMPPLFWLKMLLVTGLVGSIYLATRAGARAMAGDTAAAGHARLLGKINIALVVAIVVNATLIFN
ncbi:MAG: hypothetical protein ACR2OY_10495 [Boseongicola sp.]